MTNAMLLMPPLAPWMGGRNADISFWGRLVIMHWVRINGSLFFACVEQLKNINKNKIGLRIPLMVYLNYSGGILSLVQLGFFFNGYSLIKCRVIWQNQLI